LAIYGPLVGPPDHDGFRYLLLPVLSPWVPALYYKLRPINPYSRSDGRRGKTSRGATSIRWGTGCGDALGHNEFGDIVRAHGARQHSIVEFADLDVLVTLAFLQRKHGHHWLLDRRLHANNQLGRKNLGRSDQRGDARRLLSLGSCGQAAMTVPCDLLWGPAAGPKTRCL
jgi:hypothetical protein